MSLARIAAIAFTLAVVAAPIAARADDPAPSAADIKAASAHLAAGKRLIDARRFSEAIAEVEQAYQLDPRAEHLYNLGVAHQLGGDTADAIAYYRLFLEDSPTGSTATKAARYLAALEDQTSQAIAAGHAKAAEEDARRRAALPAVIDTTADDELARLADAAELRAKELQAELDGLAAEETTFKAAFTKDDARRAHAAALARRWERDARDAPSGGGQGRRLIGAVLLGLGVATLGYNILDAINGDDELTARGAPTILIPVGAGTSVLGLALYMSGEIAVDSPRDESTFQHVVIAPSVGHDTVEMVLSARF